VQGPGRRCQNMHILTPLFHIVHPGPAAVVYSALGRACSIVVRGLCWYSTFSTAEVSIVCSVVSDTAVLSAYDMVLEKCFFGPRKVLEFFVTKRVGTLY